MTHAPKVGGTRARLRKDTDSSRGEGHDGVGETCDWLEASQLQVECALVPHHDWEGYDNQEVSLEPSVDASNTDDQGDGSRGLGKGMTPVHAPPPEPTPLGASHVLGPLPSAPPERATMIGIELNEEPIDELNDEPALGPCTEPDRPASVAHDAPPRRMALEHAERAGAGAGMGPSLLASSLTGPHARDLLTGVRWSDVSTNPYAPLAPLVEEGEGETQGLRAMLDEVKGPRLKGPPDDALEEDGEHAYPPTLRHGNARFIGDRPEWSKRRRRRLGPLHAHASFLQHMFRRACLVRPQDAGAEVASWALDFGGQ